MIVPRPASIARVLPIAALLAAGCLSLSKAYPEKRRFVLEAPPREGTAGGPPRGVLRVEPFRAGPIHEGRELVYRTDEAEYESDFYGVWFAPPEAMLASAFEGWLRGAGLFELVVPPGAGADATASLGAIVTALHGDYRGESARAVLGVEVHVVEERSQRVLFRRAYRKDVDLPEKSAEALAMGLNGALRLVLAGLEADLRGLLALEAP